MKRYLSALLMVFTLVLFQPSTVRADEGDLLTRMNKLEENQEKILQLLEEIKSEVQIVKVRATSR